MSLGGSSGQAHARKPGRRAVVGVGVGALFAGALASCSGDRVEGTAEIVDAADRGVPVDGRGDAAPALQRLLNQAARENFSVLLPEGARARVRKTLRVPSGVSVYGPGTIVAGAKLSTLVSANPGGEDIQLVGLTLDGVHRVSGPLIAVPQGMSGLTIRGCTLKSGGTGVQHSASGSHTVISQCVIDAVTTGVKIVGSVSEVTIEHTKFQVWANRGVWIVGDATQAPRQITIDRNHFAAPQPRGTVRQPIQINGHDDRLIEQVRITGNRVVGGGTAYEDQRRPGAADLISLHRCKDFVVSDNDVSGGGDVGITVSRQCEDGEVSRNRCSKNDSVGIAIGSRPSSYVRRVRVFDNVCVDNGQDRLGQATEWTQCGILVVKAEGIQIRNNTLTDSGGRRQRNGLVVWDTTGVEVDGNRIASPSRQVLRLPGSADGAD